MKKVHTLTHLIYHFIHLFRPIAIAFVFLMSASGAAPGAASGIPLFPRSAMAATHTSPAPCTLSQTPGMRICPVPSANWLAGIL